MDWWTRLKQVFSRTAPQRQRHNHDPYPHRCVQVEARDGSLYTHHEVHMGTAGPRLLIQDGRQLIQIPGDRIHRIVEVPSGACPWTDSPHQAPLDGETS